MKSSLSSCDSNLALFTFCRNESIFLKIKVKKKFKEVKKWTYAKCRERSVARIDFSIRSIAVEYSCEVRFNRILLTFKIGSYLSGNSKLY